jgi:tape measure domain-containing protein
VTTDTTQAERGLKNVDTRARDASGRLITTEGSAKKLSRGLDQAGTSSRKFGGDLSGVTSKARETNSAVGSLMSGLTKLRTQAAQGIKLGVVEGLSGSGGLMSTLLSGNPITGLATGITSQIVGGVKDGIAAAVNMGFDFNKVKEQTLLGFEIKLKGRKEAEEFFTRIVDFAKDAEQELPQVLDSTQRLMSAFDSKQALQSLSAITDRVAATGKTGGDAKEQIDGIGLALQQMIYKGKVSGQEIMQLAERQVTAWKYLGDEIARTDAKFAAMTDEERIARVGEMAEKGMLNAKTAVAVIVRGMEKEFGGTSKRIARETLSGIESNTNDRMSELSGKGMENAFERYKLMRQEFLKKLNSQLGDNIAGSINGTAGTLIGGMDKAMAAIKSGDLKALGFEAFDSAATGIKAAGSSLFEAGASVFSMAEQGWRTAADQHSPSQVLLDLGFEAALSAATGIERGGQFLFDSGAGVAMKFQQGFAQGLKKFKPEIEKLIEENAKRTGLDPDLLRSMMKQESGGNRKAVSNKGASGLMQLMPATARSLGVSNIFDPAQNIRGGADYMAMLMKRFGGDTRKALAGYNAGPGRVDQFGGVPPASFARGETFNYVRSIMADYQRRQMISGASGGSFRADLGSQSRDTIDRVSAGTFGGHTDDLYARRAASEGELLRGLLTQRDSSKTALNALMQDAQKRLQWAEKLPQGTEGESVVRERMMYGATETIAAIQRDLDNFLNGINEQIANAQGRLQDAVLRLGTSASDGGAALGWLQQRGMDARDFSEHGSGEERRGLQQRDMREHMPPLDLNVTRNSGIASIFGASGAAVRSVKELNWTLSETPKVMEKVGTSAVDAFGNLPPLMKQVEKDNERLIGQLDDLADGITHALDQGFTDGWDGLREGFRDLLLDMTRDALNSKLRGALYDLFNIKRKDGEQDESQGGGFDLSSAIGGLFGRIFNNKPKATPGFNPAAKDNTPSAIHNAGQEAVNAVTKAGVANGTAVKTTGDATVQGLGNVSQTLLSGLGQIANSIAVGQTRGGFWSGLFKAAAFGALNGALGALGSAVGVGAAGGNAGIGGYASGQYATGGFVTGPGTATSDSILAMLSNREYVINAASVSKFGKGFFDQLNAGTMPKLPAFANGGAVSNFASSYTPASFASPAYTPAPVNARSGGAGGSNSGHTFNNHFDVKVQGGTGTAQQRHRSARQIARETAGFLQAGMRDSR